MSLTNFNKIDISSNHLKFEDFNKRSLRDVIRDIYDQFKKTNVQITVQIVF